MSLQKDTKRRTRIVDKTNYSRPIFYDAQIKFKVKCAQKSLFRGCFN